MTNRKTMKKVKIFGGVALIAISMITGRISGEVGNQSRLDTAKQAYEELEAELDGKDKSELTLTSANEELKKELKSKNEEIKKYESKEKDNAEDPGSVEDNATEIKEEELEQKVMEDDFEDKSPEINHNFIQQKDSKTKFARAGEVTFSMEATAYDGVSLGGVTASGVIIGSTGDKVVAVDPSIIPLGSMVEVEGYGVAVAADTGGAIVGNRIDLNMSTGEAISFGRRTVNVRILS